eukprot:g11814.t1
MGPGNSSAPHCAIGYRWESDVTGTVHGLGTTGQVKREGHQIHCVELDQSTVPGEYATDLSLQWYDANSGRFRSLLRRHAFGGPLVMSYQGVLALECAALGA